MPEYVDILRDNTTENDDSSIFIEVAKKMIPKEDFSNKKLREEIISALIIYYCIDDLHKPDSFFEIKRG